MLIITPILLLTVLSCFIAYGYPTKCNIMLAGFNLGLTTAFAIYQLS